MSDDQTTPDQTDQTDAAAPASSSSRPAVRSTSSSTTPDRYAAYDTRLQKFVGGVHDTSKAAKDAAKDRGVKAGDIDVRKV